MLKNFNVVGVCTTDDPTDSLESHRAYRQEWLADETLPRMFPTWRPDRALDAHDVESYGRWLDRLEAASDRSISDLDSLLEALWQRHTAFHELGCRLSDHGLETLYGAPCEKSRAGTIFTQVRRGVEVTQNEQDQLRAFLLHELAVWDHDRGWVQQFHLGALRNNNTRLRKLLGPDTGFDSIGDQAMAKPVARFLDALDEKGKLARTILYNLNPRDNELFASMIGNFQDGSVPGKMQFGSAWWFLDQLDGMEKQIDALSNLGLLSRFVGMLTDSRCFLSYSRHEYFRRLLCNMLGRDVERGLLPNDQELLMNLVENVSFQNARGYFGLELRSDLGRK
jgi:glucuronate isomerase